MSKNYIVDIVYFFFFCRFCGILNADKVGLVTAIERVMEYVYMNALAHPNSDGDEDETRFPIVKNQLLPGLRSFCSALKGEYQ